MEKSGQIEKLKNIKENTLVLILNNKYKKNWQTPENVLKYIKENWTKVNEVYIFDIYEWRN